MSDKLRYRENRKNKAFTLVELLVVISIIALLLAILMPSLNKARETAKRVICASNVKQMLLGVPLYAADNNDEMPYHCNADPTDDRAPDAVYEPYKTYSIHHATRPAGDLIQGMGRMYHTYLGDNLRIFFCPGMRNTVCAFPKMSINEPYNTDSEFQLKNNQWIGNKPFRMPNRSCYMYRAGDYDGPRVRPTDRKLTLKLSKLSGQRGLITDIWSMANSIDPVIAHKEGINAGFVDGHSSWNRIEDFSIISANYRNVNLFWDIIDNTMD